MITSNNSITIYLTRHGETDWNNDAILQGHTDIQLNTKGIEQANELAKKLQNVSFTHAFSSNLSRAFKTAQIIIGNQAVEIVGCNELRERCLGEWEGQPSSDLKNFIKKQRNITLEEDSLEKYLNFKWDDNIESYVEVYARFMDFLRIYVIGRDIAGPILVSSHGGVLRSVLYHHLEDVVSCLGDNETNEEDIVKGKVRLKVSNCAFVQLKVHDEKTIQVLAVDGILVGEEVMSNF